MKPEQPGNNKQNDYSEISPLHLWRGAGGEVDINCDMGEGIGNDAAIMPFISSANIACGYHAGDEDTMKRTVELCLKNNVVIGAHPSFFDKENFGRKEMKLPVEKIYDLVLTQIEILDKIAQSQGTRLYHVKPHGALYNMSARDIDIAKTIAKSVKYFNAQLILFGLSNSYSISEAKAIGLKTASEVFADRTYQDDGSLTPRSQPRALIENTDKSVHQVLQMIKNKTITTVTGKTFPIVAETICIHGDGKYAVEFAKQIHEALTKEGINIQPASQ
ncbi:MAG: 5-oxoprolinase subunit PxpA [Chitinophagales bacterium]